MQPAAHWCHASCLYFVAVKTALSQIYLQEIRCLVMLTL